MIIAVIPWIDGLNNDEVFNIHSPLNRDGLLDPYLEMKNEFERLGHCIHTIDCYDDLSIVDYYLFFRLDWNVYKHICRLGRADRTVYCTAEPPSVIPYNTPKGYGILKHIFSRILTWNTEWVDGESVFERNLPCRVVNNRGNNRNYEEKKLITFISSNRSSNYPGELYSERKRAICYFEQNHPDEFDFYGFGWDKDMHPCYKGEVKNKSDIFHNYRFAICFENIEGLKGYVTEKILDCISSGIVPIYCGAPDIDSYVPSECFVRFRDFENWDLLYEYLSSISREQYDHMLSSAKAFISKGTPEAFSGTKYAHFILNAINHKPKTRQSLLYYCAFRLYLRVCKAIKLVSSIIGNN